ncbi:TPA: hypothetical protein ACJI3N_005233 [Raoultella planticola]
MKRIVLLLTLISSAAAAAEPAVMTCRMSIMQTEQEKLTGVTRVLDQALVTAGHNQFYIVAGDRIIRSPELFKRNDKMAGYKSGAFYFMKANTFSVLYDDFGYVFDECSRVS